jgi:hypothetical protein
VAEEDVEPVSILFSAGVTSPTHTVTDVEYAQALSIYAGSTLNVVSIEGSKYRWQDLGWSDFMLRDRAEFGAAVRASAYTFAAELSYDDIAPANAAHSTVEDCVKSCSEGVYIGFCEREKRCECFQTRDVLPPRVAATSKHNGLIMPPSGAMIGDVKV